MKRYLSILFLLFIYLSCYGERFSGLNEDQGLSSRRCFSVKQDKNGLIWIATKLSIDRYDGHQIKHYELANPNQQSTDNIGFNYLTLSPDSTLWAYTESGSLYQYDEKSDSFVFSYSIRSHYNSYHVLLNHVSFDNNNQVILATSKGALILNINTKSVASIDVVDDMGIYHTLKHKNYYYFSTKTGLYIVHISPHNTFEIVKHLFENQFINRSFYDPINQQFWIGTFSNGVFLFPENKESEIIKIQQHFTKPVRDIIAYNDTQIALGVDGDGVFIINRHSLVTEDFFIQSETTQNNIRGNSVWDLHLDKQNTLWVATYHEGVSFSDRSYLNFQSFTHEKRNSNSLISNYINAVLEDRDHDLWFGTNNGISHLNRKTEKWTHYFQGKNQQDQNVILTLAEDNHGKIWAGGYAFGAVTIDKHNNKITKHHTKDNNPIIGSDYIYSIFKDDNSDELWMGGLYGKISMYNTETKESRIYNDESSLRCFASYNDSIIILGLYRGLYLLNKNTGEKQLTQLQGTINHIFHNGNLTYWISTMTNGLYYYDLANDSLVRFTKESHGIASNHVYAVVKDEDENLWISTEEGISKLFADSEMVENYTKQDGLISNQYIANASTLCTSNEIIFGSSDGALIFFPHDIKSHQNTESYNLLLTDFQLLGSSVISGAKDSPLKYCINKTQDITLPYNKNYFSLTFTLPNYQSSEKTKYSFFLADYDLGWSEPTNLNTASYSKLQPGKYTLHIRAYIDRFLQEERQLNIIIQQPWWNTTIAWIAYFLLFIVILFYTYIYITERYKKKQTEERMDFFINTAHDLLTPLSLIEAPLKDIAKTDSLSEESKYLMNLAINNTEKLNHFVHQLIDFQKLTLNAYNLVVRKNNVHDFFLYKTNNYKLTAAQKFISLYLNINNTEKEVYFDKEKISKILDNLLSNAIKYTPYGGKIEIHVSFHENHWYFTVKDTGIGISKNSQKMIFKYIFRDKNDANSQNVGSGVGLKMVNALVKIHKGEISFNSKKNVGTEFTVILPYRYDEIYIDDSYIQKSNKIYIESTDEIKDKLFIVASDSEMRSYLQNTFSKEYQVDSFSYGKDAFYQIERLHPDLVIVDVSLIDMDGYSFCQNLKNNKLTEHIPLILILEDTNILTLKKVFSSGATDYIKKPFDPELLKLQIINLLYLQESWKNKALSDMMQSNITTINNDRDQEFMDNLIKLIEENLDNSKLNISMLCTELGLSRTLLYNKITQLTSNSPNEFIRIIRLKNAANLLISGKYTVTEVASMVGIDNQKYFSRIFKEYYKVSPSNYLK